MKYLNLLFLMLCLNGLFNAQPAFAESIIPSGHDDKALAGGADTGGGTEISSDDNSFLMLTDYPDAYRAASRYLPAVFRSLEIQFLQGNAPVDSTAYDAVEELEKLGVPILSENKIQGTVSRVKWLESGKTAWKERGIEAIRKARSKAFADRHLQVAMLYEKLFSQGQVYKLLRELAVEMPLLPCKNEKGEKVSASIFASRPQAICVSEGNLFKNKGLTRNNVVPVIVGVVVHEIVHKLKIDSERVAYALQIPLVQAMSDSGAFHYNEYCKFCAPYGTNFAIWDESINQQLARVDGILDGISNQTDLELCNAIYAMNSEQAEKYNSTANTNRRFSSFEPIQSVKTTTTLFTLALSAQAFCRKYARLDAPNSNVILEALLYRRSRLAADNIPQTLSMKDVVAGVRGHGLLYEEVPVDVVRYTNRSDLTQILQTYRTLVQSLFEVKARENNNDLKYLEPTFTPVREQKFVGKVKEYFWNQ